MYFAALLIGALIGAGAAQNHCTADYCNNGGICVLVSSTPSCACAHGFSGQHCDTVDVVPTTAVPTTAVPSTAVPSTACDIGPCLNGGTCTPSGDLFTCACPAGFIGTVCQAVDAVPTTAVPSTACDIGPCLNGGTCTHSGDLFTCACPTGFIGTVCQAVDDGSIVTPAPTTATTAPTTAAPVPTTAAPGSGNCPPVATSDKNNVGCHPAEVVFMIEYARGDTVSDVDHEGDFIKRIIDMWQVNDQNMRIGVVTYHDTVSEVIHIDEYPNQPQALKNHITAIARRLRPSGINDLAKALNYVRTTSFTNSRPNVEKIVIPIVHVMPVSTRQGIIDAAQKLKDDCVTIIGLGVIYSRDGQNTTDEIVNTPIMTSVVTAPAESHYHLYRDFESLHYGARDYDINNCP